MAVTRAQVEEQLRRYKERVQERHRNPEARRQETPVDMADVQFEE